MTGEQTKCYFAAVGFNGRFPSVAHVAKVVLTESDFRGGFDVGSNCIDAGIAFEFVRCTCWCFFEN